MLIGDACVVDCLTYIELSLDLLSLHSFVNAYLRAWGWSAIAHFHQEKQTTMLCITQSTVVQHEPYPNIRTDIMLLKYWECRWCKESALRIACDRGNSCLNGPTLEERFRRSHSNQSHQAADTAARLITLNTRIATKLCISEPNRLIYIVGRGKEWQQPGAVQGDPGYLQEMPKVVLLLLRSLAHSLQTGMLLRSFRVVPTIFSFSF